MYKSTLTSKGQTTIPKEVRSYLGLSEGDEIEFHKGSDDKSVIMRKTIMQCFVCEGSGKIGESRCILCSGTGYLEDASFLNSPYELLGVLLGREEFQDYEIFIKTVRTSDGKRIQIDLTAGEGYISKEAVEYLIRKLENYINSKNNG